jgi:hypothetical protein
MRSLPEILSWIGSHSSRLSRPGHPAPNPLANGTVRFFGKHGPTFEVQLDAQGKCAEYTQNPAPTRIEVYGGDGALLHAEDVALVDESAHG